MPPFKDQLSSEVVAALAAELGRAEPAFPAPRFEAEATTGLEELELKARASQIADALVHALPHDLDDLEGLIGRALESSALDGWMVWPLLDAVTELTVEQPDRGLALLRRLTPRWSAEFAVRPFVDRHQATTFRHLTDWVDDPDEHVRRLVSEGTRPRLPWAPRLARLVADPSPSLPLLDRLRDDPSEYVRRSVANHLNDIAKDHPDIAVETARAWLAAGGDHVGWVVRRGLRGLVKAGHPAALALNGVDVDAPIDVVTFTVSPDRIPIGASVDVRCTARSRAAASVRAEIDLRVHYANGSGDLTRRKTFKLARIELPPAEVVEVVRRVPFRAVSIRALYPGEHLLELQLNGAIAASARVTLIEAGPHES